MSAKTGPDEGVRALWVTDAVVAAMLGVHRSTIWRWLDGELIPAPRRVGRRTFWSREEIELFARCTSMSEFRRLRRADGPRSASGARGREAAEK
jgi:predicted DNA-binding transcriptional regulator AlpA